MYFLSQHYTLLNRHYIWLFFQIPQSTLQSSGRTELAYDELKIMETGNAVEDASLAQTRDGMPSGPLERECLALRKAIRTAGIEKSTGGETGQEGCRLGSKD